MNCPTCFNTMDRFQDDNGLTQRCHDKECGHIETIGFGGHPKGASPFTIRMDHFDMAHACLMAVEEAESQEYVRVRFETFDIVNIDLDPYAPRENPSYEYRFIGYKEED